MTLRHNDFQSLIMPAHMVDKMTECVLQEKADRKPCRIGRQSQDIKRRIRVDGDTVKIKGHPVLDMRKQGIQGLIVDGIVIFKNGAMKQILIGFFPIGCPIDDGRIANDLTVLFIGNKLIQCRRIGKSGMFADRGIIALPP